MQGIIGFELLQLLDCLGVDGDHVTGSHDQVGVNIRAAPVAGDGAAAPVNEDQVRLPDQVDIGDFLLGNGLVAVQEGAVIGADESHPQFECDREAR